MKILILIKTNLFFKTSIMLFSYRNGIGNVDMTTILDLFNLSFNLGIDFNPNLNHFGDIPKLEGFNDRLLWKGKDLGDLTPFYNYLSLDKIIGIRQDIHLNPLYVYILKLNFVIFLCPVIFLILALKKFTFNIFKLINSNLFSNKKVEETNIGLNQFLKNFCKNNIFDHLRNITVYMAPRFDKNSTNSQKSFQTINNINSRMANHYNTMLQSYNSLSNLIRIHNITVYLNNDRIAITLPNSIGITEEIQIRLMVDQLIVQLRSNLSSLNSEMDYYNTASDVLRRDGFNGTLANQSHFVTLGHQLFNNLFSTFTTVTADRMQAFQIRHTLMTRLDNNINLLSTRINNTLSYIQANNITLHQDRVGSFEIGFPRNSGLSESYAVILIENNDNDINHLSESIVNLIGQLDNIESNTLGLNISLRRANSYTTMAATLQRSYTSNIHIE